MHLTGTSADEVLAQNPPPDAVEIAGPKVDLLVSAGEPPTLFVMPNFVGLPLSDAVRVLERAGMQVHRTQPRTAQSVAPAAQPPASVETQPPPPEVGQISVHHIARVVAQKPTAGEKIQPGSVVELKAE